MRTHNCLLSIRKVVGVSLGFELLCQLAAGSGEPENKP
jgi:hypothetical protein